jgi:hypothetical protein
MMSLNASWSAEFPSSQTPGVYGRRNGTKRNEFYTSISTQQREPHSLSPFSFFIFYSHRHTHPRKEKKRMLKTILQKEWNGREDSAEIEIVDAIITLSAYTVRYRYVVINYVWNDRDTITKQKHKRKSRWNGVMCTVSYAFTVEKKEGNDSVSIVSVRESYPSHTSQSASYRSESNWQDLVANAKMKGGMYTKIKCTRTTVQTKPIHSLTTVKSWMYIRTKKKEHIVQNQVDFSVKLPTFIGIGNYFKGNLKPPAYSHVIQYVFSFSCMDMI